jgi:DNA-binding XRE family transcriptional regulator
VLAVYQRAKTGENQRALAKEFKIAQQTVSDIATGRRWSHVTGEQKWPH